MQIWVFEILGQILSCFLLLGRINSRTTISTRPPKEKDGERERERDLPNNDQTYDDKVDMLLRNFSKQRANIMLYLPGNNQEMLATQLDDRN